MHPTPKPEEPEEPKVEEPEESHDEVKQTEVTPKKIFRFFRRRTKAAQEVQQELVVV
jgi:hypothetical protein